MLFESMQPRSGEEIFLPWGDKAVRAKQKVKGQTGYKYNIFFNYRFKQTELCVVCWSTMVSDGLYFLFYCNSGQICCSKSPLFPLSSVLQQQNNEVHFRPVFPAFPAAWALRSCEIAFNHLWPFAFFPLWGSLLLNSHDVFQIFDTAAQQSSDLNHMCVQVLTVAHRGGSAQIALELSGPIREFAWYPGIKAVQVYEWLF